MYSFYFYFLSTFPFITCCSLNGESVSKMEHLSTCIEHLSLSLSLNNLFLTLEPAQSAGAVEDTDYISVEECLEYDIKQSDGEAPVMLEL